jgi:hypothetical protein
MGDSTEIAQSVEIFDRARLLIDLDEATDPASPASSLLVLGLPHAAELTPARAVPELEELVVQLRDRLAELVGENGTVYRTRATELCAVIEGRLSPSDGLLDAIRTELDLDCEPFAVHVSLGCVALPGEASDPSAALALADERARTITTPIVVRLPGGPTPRAGAA